MNTVHNVFISWSGNRSRTIAQKLREWLPMVVQAAKPWMSDADIEKGSRGLDEVTKALSVPKVGIICLTPENLDTPWLLFEAGALSKAIDDTNRVCTYLLGGLAPEHVKPPMGMFQATKPTREETKRLVMTINARISDDPLPEGALDVVFEAMWPSLEATVKGLSANKPPRGLKRSTEDMLAEILELVRAQMARRSAPEDDSMLLQGMALEALHQGRPSLASLLRFVKRWSIEEGVMYLDFAVEKATVSKLVRDPKAMEALTSIATAAVGRPMRVVVAVSV